MQGFLIYSQDSSNETDKGGKARELFEQKMIWRRVPMNSIERVTLALQHKEADHVPVYPLINSVSRKALGISYEEWTKDVDKCAEAIIKTTDEVGCDVISTLVDLSVEAADWGVELVYSENAAAHPNYQNCLIKDEDGYDKIGVKDPTDPKESPRMAEHIELAKKLYAARGKEKPIVGFVFGPLGILSMMRGQDNLYMDLMDCPEKLKPALENITETVKRLSIALLDAGCCGIMYDTLFASQSIMSADMWDEFEGVYMTEIADAVREHGGMVMIHNCGNGIYIKEQVARMDPVLISLQHLPPDCATMAELKEKYGKTITIMGHVMPGFIFAGTEEEIRQECRKEIDAYKKDGGFILASGCEYPAALDFTKAKAMVDEAVNYGKY
jgi:uroporphyrinogen decarboxylase